MLTLLVERSNVNQREQGFGQSKPAANFLKKGWYLLSPSSSSFLTSLFVFRARYIRECTSYLALLPLLPSLLASHIFAH